MISLKDWRLDILNNEGTTSETYTTKGKYITIGSSLTCNIRYFDQRVLKKHCKICINVKGKVINCLKLKSVSTILHKIIFISTRFKL